ncbi:MAG: hypothetical protein RL693_2596 [Verrucomicrobiota bacterium]|jgi:F-type H+-transporting ATPase subunit delta
MKINKVALRSARQLLRACVDTEGRLLGDRAKIAVRKVGEVKPRGYLAILTAFQHLLRMEVEKRTATIESATPLTQDLREKLRADLQKKYGSDLTFEFSENPALIGGLRVKVGSHVWDGSVRAKLEALRQNLA